MDGIYSGKSFTGLLVSQLFVMHVQIGWFVGEGTEQRQNFHGLLVLFKCMLYNIRGKVSYPRIFCWMLSFVWVLVVSPERDVWL